MLDLLRRLIGQPAKPAPAPSPAPLRHGSMPPPRAPSYDSGLVPALKNDHQELVALFEQIGRTYEANMRRILAGLKELGVRTVVVGSPGAVDQHFFRPGQMMGDQPAHVAYNDNLAHLRDIDRKLADEHQQPFANVHDAMYETMKKAQEKLGNKYDVCGGDGFHPGPNGQLIMAYAFLKGLGASGNIGTITIDMQGKPTVAGGHKVLSGSEGTAAIESTQWPFCFEGDGNSSRSATQSHFAPFQAVSAGADVAAWPSPAWTGSQGRRGWRSLATRAVQPVWCAAPQPRPVSPWKYS